MLVDHSTFLIAVYSIVDSLLAEILPPQRRRGRPPRLTDSEILTVMLLQEQLDLSDYQMVSYVRTHLAAWFPRMLSQSAYNRRRRRLADACTAIALLLADRLGVADTPYQLADATPVRLGTTTRGKAKRRFGAAAAIGRGGSEHGFIYGCQVLLMTTAEGAITGWVLAPADTEGRWALLSALTWRHDPTATPVGVPYFGKRRKKDELVGPTGPQHGPSTVGRKSLVPYLVDNGFTGKPWHHHWREDLGATVITTAMMPPDTDSAILHTHRCRRQRIETVNRLLAYEFHLRYVRARCYTGVVSHVAAKCAAFNLNMYINLLMHRSPLAVGSLAWP